MSSLNSDNLNKNLDQLVSKIGAMEPNRHDLVPSNSEAPIDSSNVQQQILKIVKDISADVMSIKEELSIYKKITSDYGVKIEKLERENVSLQKKVNDLEADSRVNTVMLSGPSLNNINDHLAPRQLLDQSIAKIKQTYNYNLKKTDVANCRRIRGKNRDDKRVLITFNNAFVKSDLISSVIKKDKKNGVNLNVNEYLSFHNANLLYNLRELRKTNKAKIYSCFTRYGRVYYKLQKDSKASLISSDKDIASLASKLTVETQENATLPGNESQNEILVAPANQQPRKATTGQRQGATNTRYRQLTYHDSPTNFQLA